MAESKAKVGKLHVLVGNSGYPVLMLSAENDFETMRIFYWSKDVAVGDRVLIGPDFATAWTYRVLTRAPSKFRFGPPGFESDLSVLIRGGGLPAAVVG